MDFNECGSIKHESENIIEWSVVNCQNHMVSPDFIVNKNIKSKITLIKIETSDYSEEDPKNFMVQLQMSSEAAYAIEKVSMTFNWNQDEIDSYDNYNILKSTFPTVVYYFEEYEYYPQKPLKNIRIKCEFFYNESNCSISKLESVISDNYEELFNCGKFSDLIINVSGREFKVHKAILSARSKVFAAMLEDHTKENKENKIDINDIDANVMKEVLKFIYAGTVEDIENIALDLIPPADKYEINDLLTLCQRTIIKNISSENLKPILDLLNYIDLNLLKQATFDFIKNNRELLKTKEYSDFLNTLSPVLLTQIINAV